MRVLVLLFAFIALASAASLIGLDSIYGVVPDEYIVVLKDNESVKLHLTTLQNHATFASGNNTIVASWDIVLNGYHAKFSRATLTHVLSLPEVSYVEANGIVIRYNCLAQSKPANWGLARISSRIGVVKGESDAFLPESAGEGASLYVIDTGLFAAHDDFPAERVIPGYYTVGTDNVDRQGHGTHVASTAAGTTYGVAKKALISGVKVLGDNGSGTTAGVISGVNWVAGNAKKPAVANMSLGGGYSATLNTAVANLIKSGVVTVVAAGNDNANACSYSPASTSEALTVGAIDISDNRASFSNYGTCLDVFAPGVGITAAWIGSNSIVNTISGTSMASPHVAGIALTYVAAHPQATTAEVKAYLLEHSTDMVVDGRYSSPSRIAHVPCAW